MTVLIKLSNTQRQILEHAARQPGGKLDWFPDTVKGGARGAVLDALLHRALISSDGDGWRVAADGFAALGLPCPECVVLPAEPPQRRARDNSKQSQVIAMLQRPEGATTGQIGTATGWRPETVRGMLSGTLRKKLGLIITSSKEPGGERVYRIAEPQHQRKDIP